MERTCEVIVGAGVLGLKVAVRLRNEMIDDFILLEKQHSVGGVWHSHANGSSRVQIFEPSYRMDPVVALSDFTPQPELLEEMRRLLDADGMRQRVRLGCEVLSIRDAEGGQDEAGVAVVYRDASGCERSILAKGHVLLCTGGLQRPRRVDFVGEGSFGSDIIEGTGGAIDRVPLHGRRVAVLGMGAFAVENARTALLSGAEHVTLVARSRNLVISRLIAFLHSSSHGANLFRDGDFPQVAEAGGGRASESKKERRNRFILGMVQAPYQMAGVEHLVPERLFGATAPTASDVFFIALKLGRLSVVVGEVTSFGAGCLHVCTQGPADKASQPERLEDVHCNVVVKCFGFEPPDRHLGSVVGCDRIRSPMYISERILLLKVEHNALHTASWARHALDLGGSATVVAELCMEIFLHFRNHPEDLRATLPQLPHPTIFEEGYTDWLDGFRRILDCVPGVAERASRLRARYGAQVTSKYPQGLSDFLRQNQQDWEDACAALTGGNRHAVPYLWAGMESMVSTVMPKKRSPSADILAASSKL